MKEVVEKLIELNKTISTMESCTGGALAYNITNVEGASAIFNFGAVTYSNEYKVKMGVDKEIIKKYTVYSIEVAREMSKSISNYTNSDYGVGITGKINKEDPNNKFQENDVIFVSIYNKNKDEFYDMRLKAINASREENKKKIVSKIALLFMEIL